MKKFLALGPVLTAMTVMAWFTPATVHAYRGYGVEAVVHFEEGADSTAADSSGNGRTLLLKNGTAWSTAGRTGNALSLDGTNDYAVFADTGNFNLYDEVTICAWVNVAAGGVVVARGSYVNPFYLSITSNRNVAAGVNTETNGSRYYTTGGTITWNEWHHVALTYKATVCSVRIYIDGQVALADTQKGKFPANFLYGMASERMYVGQRANGYYLRGLVDDLRICSRAATAEEIAAIYNNAEVRTDTTAPATPGSVTATAVSPRIVRVTWAKAQDNVKVMGYNIYCDDRFLYTVHEDSVSHLVFWLTPSTQYGFAVSAVDFNRNESPRSVPVYARTNDEINPNWYVGGTEINHEMTKVTTACMETLRSKRIIMYAKSFGGSLVSGYSRLKSAGSPYYLEAIQEGVNFDTSSFTQPMLIKGDCGQRYPATARIDTLGNKLKDWAGTQVDAAFVFWHLVTASVYSYTEDYQYTMYYYMNKIDSLRLAYPQVKVFYGLVGCVGELDAGRESNMTSVKFNEIINNYKRGLAPIYDHASVLSVDTLSDDTAAFSIGAAACRNAASIACIDSSCLRHSKIACPDSQPCPMIPGSGLHPNAAYEKRMALGMTLLLAKLFCPSCFETPTAMPAPAAPGKAPAFAVSVNPSSGTFRVIAGAPVRTVWLYNATGAPAAVLAVERGLVNWKAQAPGLQSGVYFASIDQGRTRVKLVLMR